MPFLFVLILCATLAQAEQQMIRVQLEYIETDQPTLKQALDAPAPYPLILGKLKKDEAQRYNTEILTTNNGTTATSEAICEIIFPTESQGTSIPHAIPSNPQLSTKKNWTGLSRPSSFFGAWETRNTGCTFEIQATLSKELINLRFTSEDVLLQKMEVIQPFKDRWGTANIQLPFFSSKRPSTGLTLAPGQPLLIANYSPLTDSGKPDPSRPILLFVTATILTNS